MQKSVFLCKSLFFTLLPAKVCLRSNKYAKICFFSLFKKIVLQKSVFNFSVSNFTTNAKIFRLRRAMQSILLSQIELYLYRIFCVMIFDNVISNWFRYKLKINQASHISGISLESGILGSKIWPFFFKSAHISPKIAHISPISGILAFFWWELW